MEIVNIDKLYRKTNTFHQMNHYTSPEGLLSIISSSELRFTDCAFLNDIEEFNYIKKVLEQCFSKKKDKELKESIETLVLDKFKKDNEGFLLLNKNGKLRLQEAKYYVLSGSKNGDDLPMWVYYSKNGDYRGYCINIDVDKLINEFESIDGTLLYGQIEYDLEKQVQIIENNIRDFANTFYEKSKPFKNKDDEDSIRYLDECIDEYQESLYELISKMRLFFKSSKFKHEKEYRVAILASPDNETIGNENKKIEKTYFIKNGVIVPCLSVVLKNNLPIRHIVVGPTMDFDFSKLGIRNLLISKKVENGENLSINKSSITIRY